MEIQLLCRNNIFLSRSRHGDLAANHHDPLSASNESLPILWVLSPPNVSPFYVSYFFLMYWEYCDLNHVYHSIRRLLDDWLSVWHKYWFRQPNFKFLSSILLKYTQFLWKGERIKRQQNNIFCSNLWDTSSLTLLLFLSLFVTAQASRLFWVLQQVAWHEVFHLLVHKTRTECIVQI
jgi:hypothetical protein